MSSGLAAVSTQHPGLHWHAAADYYRIANVYISTLWSMQGNYSFSYPDPDPLSSLQPFIFYGQRPWRAGIEDGSLASEAVEKNAQLALMVLFYIFIF